MQLGINFKGRIATILALFTIFQIFPSGFFMKSAFAKEGMATDWQFGFQDSVTEVMDMTNDFHNLLLIIITVITLFVMALLLYVMMRFNENSNPTPSKVTHSTALEFAWTVVPIIILFVIAVPSFRLLYKQYEFPTADITVKAIGQQWYWDYVYPDHDEIEFSSTMLGDDELKSGQPRLLATDNPLVVPVNKVVHVLVTADPSGVIHNWAVPSFGSKVDAVPGRVTRTWFKARKTGTFYGQCSELCGKDHAFMPVEVKVVSDSEFKKWLDKAKEEYASGGKVKLDVQTARGQKSQTTEKLAGLNKQ